jgi:hypothetical protein
MTSSYDSPRWDGGFMSMTLGIVGVPTGSDYQRLLNTNLSLTYGIQVLVLKLIKWVHIDTGPKFLKIFVSPTSR